MSMSDTEATLDPDGRNGRPGFSGLQAIPSCSAPDDLNADRVDQQSPSDCNAPFIVGFIGVEDPRPSTEKVRLNEIDICLSSE
jgi:hypothetical protein